MSEEALETSSSSVCGWACHAALPMYIYGACTREPAMQIHQKVVLIWGLSRTTVLGGKKPKPGKMEATGGEDKQQLFKMKRYHSLAVGSRIPVELLDCTIIMNYGQLIKRMVQPPSHNSPGKPSFRPVLLPALFHSAIVVHWFEP
eukprot:358234-Chlamydomonas_euryale.AAC.6